MKRHPDIPTVDARLKIADLHADLVITGLKGAGDRQDVSQLKSTLLPIVEEIADQLWWIRKAGVSVLATPAPTDDERAELKRAGSRRRVAPKAVRR